VRKLPSFAKLELGNDFDGELLTFTGLAIDLTFLIFVIEENSL
jgi:hypothetical protein